MTSLLTLNDLANVEVLGLQLLEKSELDTLRRAQMSGVEAPSCVVLTWLTALFNTAMQQSCLRVNLSHERATALCVSFQVWCSVA